MSSPSIKLLITGATGTAGSEALRQSLLSPNISHITLLTRRPLPPHIPSQDPKLTIITHEDFLQYPPELLTQVKGYDGCIWDLGLSSSRKTEAEYELVTKDYAVAAATAFATLGTRDRKFVFCYLSGSGSDQEEGSWGLYSKIKGRAELALACLRDGNPTLATYSFRPTGIMPLHATPHASSAQKFANFLMPGMRKLPVLKGLVIEADTLAKGMIQAVLMGSQGWIDGWVGKGLVGNENAFENEEIKVLAGDW